jgi:hypothetical protein
MPEKLGSANRLKFTKALVWTSNSAWLRLHGEAREPPRLHDGSITLGVWLQYTQQFWSAAADRKGLITIRDRRETVHALYSYHVRSGLIGRGCLCITNLIMAHLAGFKINHAVHESARQLASDLDCQTISIGQPFQPQLSAGNLLYHLSSAKTFPADLRYLNENEQK